MNDVEGVCVALSVHDGSNTTGVAASGDHAEVAGIELDEVHDFVGVDVQPDGVVDLDEGIGVPDGPPVRRIEVWDSLRSDGDLLDAAQLVLGLLTADAMNGEPTLDVVDQAEVLVGLLDLDDVHESAGEAGVGPHLSVDLDEPVLEDGADLLGVDGVAEPVAQEQSQGHRLAELVGSGRRPGGESSSQLGQHPRLGRRQALQMLLRSSSHLLP